MSFKGEIIDFLVRIVCLLIPQKETIVFTSYPDYSDNAYGLYKYFLRNREKLPYKLVWILSSKRIYKKKKKLIIAENPETIVAYRFSIVGLYFYFSAKHIFCTHGINDFFRLPQKDKIINLWHGMPFKKAGILDRMSLAPTKGDIFIATSEVFQKLMADSFLKPISKVLLVGQPRNDLLFTETDYYLKNKINVSQFTKIGIWLPTYHKSIIGHLREDGKIQEGKIAFLGNTELIDLNDFLSVKKILLLIKLHPMDILQKHEFPELTNIHIIKEVAFDSQLYPLLGNSDFLLTDYSSVWIDYEILGRPIGFVLDDYSEYSKTRGLNFENIEKILPGPILSKMDDLKGFILRNPTRDFEKGTLFNLYKDGNSSERLVNYLKL